MIADDEMGQVFHIVDGHVIPDIAGNDQAVADARRQLQIVMLQHPVAHPADPDQPEEVTVFDLPGVKLIGHQKLVPIVGVVSVFDKLFQLIRAQMAPRGKRPGKLAVAKAVFVLAGRKVLGGDEISADAPGWPYRYMIH